MFPSEHEVEADQSFDQKRPQHSIHERKRDAEEICYPQSLCKMALLMTGKKKKEKGEQRKKTKTKKKRSKIKK